MCKSSQRKYIGYYKLGPPDMDESEMNRVIKNHFDTQLEVNIEETIHDLLELKR